MSKVYILLSKVVLQEARAFKSHVDTGAHEYLNNDMYFLSLHLTKHKKTHMYPSHPPGVNVSDLIKGYPIEIQSKIN